MATRDYWAFLIQREGDRSWLPLDTLETEILEGSYRIIARSQRRNVDVEVRIEHVSNRQPLPQHWSQKRMAKTNEKGFLLVLPFTAMQPGKWEVVCTGDIMSDLRGDNWRHSLKLQVLPTTVEANSVPPKQNALAADHVAPKQNTRNDAADRVPHEPVIPEQNDCNDAAARVTPAPVDPAFADLTALMSTAPVPPDVPTAPGGLTPLARSDEDDTIHEWDIAPEPPPHGTADSAAIGETGLSLEPAMPMDSADDLSMFDALFSAEDEPLWSDSFDELSQLDTYIEPDDASDLGDVDHADVMTFTDADVQALEAETTHLSNRDRLYVDTSQALPPSDLTADFSWGMDIRTGATAAMDDADVAAEPAAPKDTESVEPVVAESTGPTVAESVEPTVTESVEPTVTESVEPVSELVQPVVAEPADSITASPSVVSALIDASDVLPAQAAIDRPRLTIELVPSIYHFRRGEVLMVYGQVMSERMPTVISQAELVVKLIDPQTASPLAIYRQTLEQQAFPLVIAAPLGVPDTVSAQLLVGEVVLDDAGAEPLAQQTFTATAAIDDLFAAIGPVDPPPETKQRPDPPRPAVDFGFFNFIGDVPADAPAPAPRHKLESMQDVELPGASSPEQQLHVDAEAIAASTPDLEAVISPALDPVLSDDLFDRDDEFDRSVDEPVDDRVVIEADIAPEAVVVDSDTDDLDSDDLDLPGLDDAIAPVLDDGLPAHDVATLEVSCASDLEAPAVSPTNLDPVASEVVVDDLPEALPTPRPVTPLSNPLLLAADQPVPEPTLVILEQGDLVVGQAIHLRVKLPDILPKLYVKLWINDRQTRTLLDGPRWMVDFVLNDHGELEATTQLTLPFGSLEIQIAAITVEAATKRESYRAMLDQVVISPNLDEDMSELSFDEL